MVKNFRVKGTHRCPNLEIPDVPVDDLPSLTLRKLGLRVGKYKPIPTTGQWQSYNFYNDPDVSTSDYIQHRQQDNGRAIALGQDKANGLLRRAGNVWTFQSYERSRGQATVKTYTVTWDGLGTPPPGVSTSTYSQGKTYRRSDGTTGNLVGLPDKYTWAVWFYINGIPPDNQWPPIPSLHPNWAFLPVWVEYDLNT